MHEQRSHRDIKAGNVIVSGWGSGDQLKIHLIDWANSRLHEEGKANSALTAMLQVAFMYEVVRQKHSHTPIQ